MTAGHAVDETLLSLLACPRDYLPLEPTTNALSCAGGHRYAVVDGVPVLLRDDLAPTYWGAESSLRAASAGTAATPPDSGPGVDSWVQEAIVGTCGNMYRGLQYRLREYPIPELPLPGGEGRTLLDVGCSWGRWTVAAARRGYVAIGVDPHLDAVRAARRVAARLGIDAQFVVGDARCLPFATGAIDTAFSYSVIQHFSRTDAAAAFADIGRVLNAGGLAKIQMANAFGGRNVQQQIMQPLRERDQFDVRYWRPSALLEAVIRAIGPASLSVDGFFSLNPQPLPATAPARYRAAVGLSRRLRQLAESAPWLVALADSVFVTARRSGDQDASRTNQ